MSPDLDRLLVVVREMGVLRGIPQFLFAEGIDMSSMLKVRRAVTQFKQANPEAKELDFIINSPGGSPADAYRIIKVLRTNFEFVNIVVPFWAKSAATLLSLGGSSILMDDLGEFGPLDMQLAKERDDSPDYDRESALNDEHSLKRLENRAQVLYQTMFRTVYQDKNIPINRNELSKHLFDYIAHFYQPLLAQINPYKLGEKKRKLEVGEKYAEKILTQYHPYQKKEVKRIMIDYLVNGCPDHTFNIDEGLMRIFLPEVVRKASEVSPAYGNKVQELSNLLIEYDPEKTTHVDFVLPLPAEVAATSGTDDATTGSASDKANATRGNKNKPKTLASQNGKH